MLQAHLVYVRHIAWRIETDAQNGLINGLWHRKGELPRIARDIIPFVAVELRFETGSAQSPFNRSPVIDARMNRIDEKSNDQISLMRTHAGAACCASQENGRATWRDSDCP